ncbi:MAG: ATP-dependent Clp protease ATP-binding subunit ClpA [Deltaproteobacteria bacterium]|nr:ATP-dependent Clp protease ATP-binding subunit ClpA [Deltaproteobacteria bacterium]
MISRELQATLGLAVAEAKRRRHGYLTLEHVLYALLHDEDARDVIRHCGGEVSLLRRQLEEYLDESVEKLAEGDDSDPIQTLAFQRVMHRAALHVQSAGKRQIDSVNVLVALFRETGSHALYLLEQQDVSRLDVLNFISHGISKVPEGEEDDGLPSGDEMGISPADQEGESLKDPLGAYTQDLVQRAKEGKIDPLIGRHAEIERTIHVLSRRRKNNPIFVGDAGVGKTALAEGLARKIARNEVPEVLREAKIYALDMGSLLAGTKFRGEFELRVKAVLKALQKEPGAILFIDEIHTLVGAGAATGGAMDASTLLKPALASGELRCIGSTTYHDYKSYFERDRALSRRFQRIEVGEPSVGDAIQILRGLKPHYEEYHGVTYSQSAIRAAAELSAKHINDRHLPDKAIDVLDEAGAKIKLQPKGRKKMIVTSKDIESIVSQIARVPVRNVSISDREALATLADDLKQVVFGQEEAITALSAAIKMSRSGLGAPTRPVGSFLFSGPTGVGKTEVAVQLARIMGVTFERFDMSEYMEKHTISRLIGAPPGYVGFDQGGLLTDAIIRNPYTVLLLDEIEKAHPDVFNVLLQVMDHATLTDNNGRKADFRNVILIMTTNAGAQAMSKQAPGFMQSGPDLSKGKEAIERMFSPEFRNRLDAIIGFSALPPEIVAKVVEKFLTELDLQLAEKRVDMEVTHDAREWLAERGYEAAFGARPMARLIQTSIKQVLADDILFGRLKSGGKVVVDIDPNDPEKLSFTYPEAEAS